MTLTFTDGKLNMDPLKVEVTPERANALGESTLQGLEADNRGKIADADMKENNAQLSWYNAHVQPWVSLGKDVANLIGQIWTTAIQQEAMERYYDVQDKKAEIADDMRKDSRFLNEKLIAFKEKAVEVAASFQEKALKIMAKKDVALAEIASDTKKALYNAQARKQLFLASRFYGNPAKTA
ncbi:MAG: hypothetical protein HYV02_05005 [Deltaproteobacteria bacterium]|nr:hypothetical protein [Deltaproteobacteria bacterium]